MPEFAATSRKALRDGVKTVLKTAFRDFTVSTNRIEDIRDIKDAILITLENVDVEYQLDGNKVYEGDLNIRYLKLNGSDDELDLVADQIEAEIKGHSPAITGSRGFMLDRISYEDYESVSNTITLSYSVRF